MLKRVFQLLTLAAVVNVIYQHWPRGEADELIPVMDAYWDYGCVDLDGRVRIEFEWQDMKSFNSDGFAHVWKMGFWGLVDKSGKVIAEPEWQVIGEFDQHGLAQVQKENFAGWINRQGEVVIPAQWDPWKSPRTGPDRPDP